MALDDAYKRLTGQFKLPKLGFFGKTKKARKPKTELPKALPAHKKLGGGGASYGGGPLPSANLAKPAAFEDFDEDFNKFQVARFAFPDKQPEFYDDIIRLFTDTKEFISDVSKQPLLTMPAHKKTKFVEPEREQIELGQVAGKSALRGLRVFDSPKLALYAMERTAQKTGLPLETVKNRFGRVGGMVTDETTRGQIDTAYSEARKEIALETASGEIFDKPEIFDKTYYTYLTGENLAKAKDKGSFWWQTRRAGEVVLEILVPDPSDFLGLGLAATIKKPTTELLEEAGEKGIEKVASKGLKEIPYEEVIKKQGLGKKVVTDAERAYKAMMNVIKPAIPARQAVGREPVARTLMTFFEPEGEMVRFGNKRLETVGKTVNQIKDAVQRFGDDQMKYLYRLRGTPFSDTGKKLQAEAAAMIDPKLRPFEEALQKISDDTWEAQKEFIEDPKYVEDYFYGIYKAKKGFEKRVSKWLKTTDRFTKEKVFRSPADAEAFGFELIDKNPVSNLLRERLHVEKLRSMKRFAEDALSFGEDIAKKTDAEGFREVPEKVLKGLYFKDELADLIEAQIKANALLQNTVTRGLRKAYTLARVAKFFGSGFHQLSITGLAIADTHAKDLFTRDNPVLQLARASFPKMWRKTQESTEYIDYIKHGGGHAYSIEAESQDALKRSLDRLFSIGGEPGKKIGRATIGIPAQYTDWLFNDFIPSVKFQKYSSEVAQRANKLGRELTSDEKMEIIKIGQNFYGELNERLFGRKAEITSGLRFLFTAPGFAEGNYRAQLKALFQWTGGKGSRERAVMAKSIGLKMAVASMLTYAITGEWPKKPEEISDVRDLGKVNTGIKDSKGREVMIDTFMAEKDYWGGIGNLMLGQFGDFATYQQKRVGGMLATIPQVFADALAITKGESIYDWKNDKVVEVTDPFAKKVLDFLTYEATQAEPIAAGTYKRMRDKNFNTLYSLVGAMSGFRPVLKEKELKRQSLFQRVYALKGNRGQLYAALDETTNPTETIDDYNKTIEDMLDNPLTMKYLTEEERGDWYDDLYINRDKYIDYVLGRLDGSNLDENTRRRYETIIKNFEAEENK